MAIHSLCNIYGLFADHIINMVGRTWLIRTLVLSVGLPSPFQLIEKEKIKENMMISI